MESAIERRIARIWPQLLIVNEDRAWGSMEGKEVDILCVFVVWSGFADVDI